MSTEQNTPSAVPPSTPSFSTNQQQEGNGLAIASLVLGIVSFVMCGPLCSIPAVITGHISLKKIRLGIMPADSKGFAMAGTILGYVNLALTALAIIVFIVMLVFASGAGHVSPFIYKL